MKLISINVSQPKEIDWKGKRVRTSIFKQPVTGRRRVGKLNIEGDLQADLEAHGGEHRAIMVYQRESYDYWRKELHLDNLRYGQFGENFTVEGLPDNEVCIGDRFQVGTAVFEVTQPRVTCYKVGISLGVPDMPALLVSHKRPGFYCRVICEGEVGAGDLIVKLASGAGNMTVAEIDGLLYGKAHPVDRLLRALHISALSEGWRSSFQALYASIVSGTALGNAGLAPAGVAAWTGYRPFKVSRVVRESEGVRSFELAPADGRALPPFKAGQHIIVKIPATDDRSIIRMYSLCGPVNENYYRIAVKMEEYGEGSQYLHRHIRAGDQLDIAAPRGYFTLAENDRPLVLMGAGIGITPLLAMLDFASKNDQGREIWWIYTTQNKRHYPFCDEVKRIFSRIAGYTCKTVFSRPETADVQGRDFDIPGRLTPEVLRSLELPRDGDYYLCGPEGYLLAVKETLKELGIADRAIKYETFHNAALPVTGTQPPHLPEGDPGEGPEVTFARSRISFKWHTRFANLLEATEACNIPAGWSCRSGVCHRCETALLSGEVSYVYPPLEEPANGNVLICCSVPVTDIQLEL